MSREQVIWNWQGWKQQGLSPGVYLKCAKRREKSKKNCKLSAYISNRRSNYSKQSLDNVKIICCNVKIYVPQVCADVWYIGNIFILTIPVEVDLQKQYRIYDTGKALPCKQSCILIRASYQKKIKKRNTIYCFLTPNDIAELKPWYILYVDLISTYRKSIIHQQLGGAIINSYVSLT